MKSSRSTSKNNIRRNARRVLQDSSDDSDARDSSTELMDSAHAEKLFSRRRSNLNTTCSTSESINFQNNKTLFRISDTSDSDSSESKNIIRNKDNEMTVNSSNNSINKSGLKLSNNDLLKYRSIRESTDDDQSKSSNFNISNDILVSDVTANESFITIPRNYKNKQRLISDSSDDSDIEQGTQLNSNSESSVDIINSSNVIPNKINFEKSEIETKLQDLSLIEPSDSDTSEHYKSTIASSNQNRLLYDESINLKLAHKPSGQSSILENSDSEEEETTNNLSNNSIEVITLDDSHEEFLPKEQYHPVTIDLTKTILKESSTLSQGNSTKLFTSDVISLKMEKMKLNEIIAHMQKNIDTMKNTMKITNLHLLPDGGFKLKNAISKQENELKDTKMQLKMVIAKLNEFGEETNVSIKDTNSHDNIGNALTKKAAANINIKDMGDKALSTYRAQQALTLDILHTLHKSLETCPNSSVLSDDPVGLKVDLMVHQKHAIAWLMWRENQKPRGGILADDMGLGKTLTMLSLILKASESKHNEDDSDIHENTSTNTIKGGTLIICPPSLIGQWKKEIDNKLRPRILDVVQHHGQNRESSARRLARKDVVITTYSVVMWDHKSLKRNTSPLFQIKWDRIILDEAHAIRNFKSQTAIAVTELSGIKRWALTGTPIHNKESDFYALLKFIKCRPFDEWAVWKRWVGNNDEAGKNRLSLIVKTLMLRRTKTELSATPIFNLPQKHINTFFVELFKEEKEAYEKVLQFSSSLFASYLYEKAEKEEAIKFGFPVKNKVKYLQEQNIKENIFHDHPELDKLFKQLKNNTDIKAHHILVLILRLRQLCCHPCLMKNILEDESLQIDGIQSRDNLELVDHMSRMSIGIPVDNNKTDIKHSSIFNESWVSSKIKAVCDLVNEKVLNTDDKAVIVSQWPSMLLLVDKQLSKYKVKTEMFSGAVPVVLRNKIISDFNNSKGGPKILLLSLTVGGVGLNLVVANHLFLIDVHWNPQLEAQACDRIYRIGQMKPVNIYKFVCSNTIEQSIQAIQLKKIEISNNLLSGGHNKVEGTKITLDDLKLIFNINSNVK